MLPRGAPGARGMELKIVQKKLGQASCRETLIKSLQICSVGRPGPVNFYKNGLL